MKKIIRVLFFLIFVYGCSSEGENTTTNMGCKTTELGINEKSKFSNLYYEEVNGEFQLNLELSEKWLWSISNDTIQVGGFTNVGGEATNSAHIFLKKNDQNCVDFLFYRDAGCDDFGTIFDSETNEIIKSACSWTDYYDVDFSIQEYIEGERLLCKVGRTSVWIEFKSELLKEDKWYYEVETGLVK